MVINYLDWDTDFFGFKIGKIEISNEHDFNPALLYEQANDENYGLVYVFKYGKMLNQQTISKAGIELVDIMLTMSKKLNKKDYSCRTYKFRTELSSNELEDCYRIAEQTSIVSRFYNERKIGPEKTKELYRKWIDNAINKSIADGLILVNMQESVVGINAIKTDEKNKVGFCSLIGVNNIYQKLGIGEKLWEQSFSYWVKEKDVDYCKVPFSLQNHKSFNFHLKMGFNKIEEIKYIYHYRNNNFK